jgi:hypothetical protein
MTQSGALGRDIASGARLRPWHDADRALGLRLFDSNVPGFFAAVEKADYAAFLDDLPGPYFVLESADGEALGCGGYAAEDDPAVAALCWGMVRGDLHGLRLGELLLRTRLDLIAADPAFRSVDIETTQHSYGFFARYGFVETKRVPDGFAPGMDWVGMTLDLAVPGQAVSGR